MFLKLLPAVWERWHLYGTLKQTEIFFQVLGELTVVQSQGDRKVQGLSEGLAGVVYEAGAS